MKSVKFLHHFSKWNGGEVAGFQDDYAKMLVESGHAEWLEQKAAIEPEVKKVVEAAPEAKKKTPRKKKSVLRSIFGE